MQYSFQGMCVRSFDETNLLGFNGMPALPDLFGRRHAGDADLLDGDGRDQVAEGGRFRHAGGTRQRARHRGARGIAGANRVDRARHGKAWHGDRLIRR